MTWPRPAWGIDSAAMSDAAPASPTLGVFDSGVGGLSVLRSLHRRLPDAALHYIADSAYAPYGDRSVEEVTRRCFRLTEHLIDAGARLVVVACNTATTMAITSLRQRWPELAFVGVEPGVKPAALLTRNRRIGVMATMRTIGSDRLKALVETHAGHCEVHLQACPGLADAIETGRLDDRDMDRLLESHCAPLRDAGADTVVLGCTHYPFVAERIQRHLPGVTLVDTAEAVAQRAESVWRALGSPSGDGGLKLETTGDPLVLETLARRWLGVDASAHRIVLE